MSEDQSPLTMIPIPVVGVACEERRVLVGDCRRGAR